MYFSGSSKKISLRGESKEVNVSDLVEDARQQRENLKQQKLQAQAARKIQIAFRKYQTINVIKQEQRSSFDSILKTAKLSNEVLQALIRKLTFFYNKTLDVQRFMLLSKLVAVILTRSDQSFFLDIGKDGKQNCTQRQLVKYINIALDVINSNIINNYQSLDLTTVSGNKGLLFILKILFNLLNASLYHDQDTFAKVCTRISTRLMTSLSRLLIIANDEASSFENNELYLTVFSILKRVLSSESEALQQQFIATILTQPDIYTNVLGKSSTFRGALTEKTFLSGIMRASARYNQQAMNERPDLLLANLITLVNDMISRKVALDATGMKEYSEALSLCLKSVVYKSSSAAMEENQTELIYLLPKSLQQKIKLLYDKGHLTALFNACYDKEFAEAPAQNTASTTITSTPSSSFGSFGFNPFAQAITSSKKVDEKFVNFCKLVYYLMQIDTSKNQLIFAVLGFSISEFLPYLWSTLYKVRSTWMNEVYGAYAEMVGLFAKTYDYVLSIIDDEDFYGKQKPFTLKDNVVISGLLKDFAFNLFSYKSADIVGLRNNITSLLVKLWSRDSRKNYAPPNHWSVEDTSNFDFSFLNGTDFRDESTSSSTRPEADAEEEYTPLHVQRAEALARALTPTSSTPKPSAPSQVAEKRHMIENLLKSLPFVFPFDTRVKIFQQFIDQDASMVNQSWVPPVIVRRDYIFEDAYTYLHGLTASRLKQDIRVQFRNETGLVEEGIGQGVFKEFFTELIKEAFSAKYGLFKYTPDFKIYPNPASELASENHLEQFEFLGKMIGKALFDKILVDVPFARFFVAKVLGKKNYFNDLHSLDPELEKNLNFLKYYNGDVEDLSLNFTLLENEFGEEKEIELIRNGRNTPVTNDNKYAYILAMANYKLNVQIRRQSKALLKGLSYIIPTKWLQLFNEDELLLLICGSEKPVDIEDLRANTQYAGGYSASHPTIKLLWKVLHSLNNNQRKLFLKFATSSPRPPILGFKELHPSFCIKMSSERDVNMLPRSSTCFNVLYLPPYQNEKSMREKLVIAIEQTGTFELT